MNNTEILLKDTARVGGYLVATHISILGLIADGIKIGIDSYIEGGEKVVKNVINEKTRQTSWIW